MAELSRHVDLVAMPTAPAGSPSYDGLDMGSFIDLIFTPYWNPVGCPALALPMGLGPAAYPCHCRSPASR